MDYLYSQLPELVYDPADLIGKSSNGTIDLKIDNNKREIDAQIKGKLYLYDPNTDTRVEYNGANDINFEIPIFEKDSLKVEYVKITGENINDLNKIESLKDCKVGDVCLKIWAESMPTEITYVPIPTPVTSGNIQRVTSSNI